MKIIISAFLSLFIITSSVRADDTAIFAMGCFWCSAAAYAYHKDDIKLPGVKKVRAGYGGGKLKNPTYENHGDHLEVVRVTYDPAVVTYEKLLEVFWKNIDPFDDKGQFCDKGNSYKSAIFYANDMQKALAEKTKAEVAKKFGKTVVTKILPASTFTEAEEYHQDYKAKNPVRYHYYTWRCGRVKRLKELWGKPPRKKGKMAGV